MSSTGRRLGLSTPVNAREYGCWGEEENVEEKVRKNRKSISVTSSLRLMLEALAAL